MISFHRSPVDASLGRLGTDYSFLLELMELEKAEKEEEGVNINRSVTFTVWLPVDDHQWIGPCINLER